MIKVFSVSVCCAVAMFLAGCSFSGAGREQPVTKLEKGVQVAEADLAKTGETYFRQIIAALQTGDHAKFTEHYIEEAKKKITKDVFDSMSASFKMSNGSLKQFKYLGSINKYSGRILLWSAIFERTPAVNTQLKKAGYDPAKVPDTESLVQMMIGKTDKGWKIIRMGVQ